MTVSSGPFESSMPLCGAAQPPATFLLFVGIWAGFDLNLCSFRRPRQWSSPEAAGNQIYFWLTRWMFRHDEYTKRCSAHAFGDAVEVRTFYDDLIATGRNLAVSMPAMETYAEDIKRFAATPHGATEPRLTGMSMIAAGNTRRHQT
jgi:hypothetical protein